MGWAERLNPNSERNIEKFNNAPARARHREKNEEREQEAAGGDAESSRRSPLYAYGRAVLRSAKARRRAEKIAAAAAKLEASVKRAKEEEDTNRETLVVDDSDVDVDRTPGGST